MSWASRASCKGTDPSVWFDLSLSRALVSTYCMGCPVQAECLRETTEEDYRQGVTRGGMWHGDRGGRR